MMKHKGGSKNLKAGLHYIAPESICSGAGDALLSPKINPNIGLQ
jgi:hypothetical protein